MFICIVSVCIAIYSHGSWCVCADPASTQHVRPVRLHACRGARSLCLRLLVLFLVGITFAGVYMFIKLTSMAGFKTPRAPVAP